MSVWKLVACKRVRSCSALSCAWMLLRDVRILRLGDFVGKSKVNNANFGSHFVILYG